jgi:uncharacterized protein (TIGR02246 family)
MSMEKEVRALYGQVVDGWNNLDAAQIASAFSPDGDMIGFDGSVMRGASEIAAALGGIFKDHKPGRWVPLIRDVRSPAAGLAVLLAHCGWFMSDSADTFPQAVQTVVASRGESRWKITLLQTTPAALHGRPADAQALARELRAAALGTETHAAGTAAQRQT